MPAKTGAYVADRLEEELALLRALSASEECSIVGEDLGTVPQEVRDGLEESGFFSYRLLMFEKEWDGRFKTPGNFPRNALISFGTHDLPTLDGWWSGRDLEVKRSLARYPDEEAELGERQGRENDRLQLVAALREQGFLSKGEEPDMSPGAQPGPGGLDALAAALYAYLAKTPCGLLLVNLDDMLGEIEMQNLPGTLQEHPNWRRRVSLPRERWDEFPRVRKIAEAIQRERG
jgi:4-alpha-glucanotransferase